MITLFEKFTNESSEPKTSGYIKDYLKVVNGKVKIPSLNFDDFNEKQLLTANLVPLQYNNLMRFYLFMELLKYNGTSPIILSYVNGLKNKDKFKIEIINKIPNNLTVMRMINKIFKLNYPIDHNYNNSQDLKKFIFQYQNILSDRNLTEYINTVYEVSKKASMSERIVRGVINMLYSRFYEITYAKLSEDLKGMDLWKIDKKTGIKQSIQVKNITGSVKFKIKEDVIYIDGTNLDLKKHKSWEGRLPYDYLVFYLEKEKKICIIKSNAIFAIDKFDDTRTIKIRLKNWAMDERFHNFVFKLIDVPAKFIKKDVTQIFYSPEIEQEIQFNNPDVEEIEEPVDESKNRGVFY